MQHYRDAGQRLGPAGYGAGGDPMLARHDDADWFVVPFRPTSGDADPVAARAGERLTDQPDHRELSYQVPFGPWAKRLEQGRARLDAALAANPDWTAASPLFVNVNLGNVDPVGSPGDLDQAWLTLSYRLADE
jgi:hypothetical protein